MERCIYTDRLCLRTIDAADAENMIRILSNNNVKMTYMVPDLDSEGLHRLFKCFQTLSEDPDRYVRGIYLQDTLIGWINDQGFEDKKIELGWVIDPGFSNQGYATEAVKAAVKDLFLSGIRTVYAGAFSHNAASIRVMEKAGMHLVNKTERIEYRNRIHLCVFYEINNI